MADNLDTAMGNNTIGNSSDVDAEVQSNQPLFLTFTPGLQEVGDGKKKKRSNVYRVSGVNILNRNSVDSKTALERLQRRRENHNFVERRRRDNINHTIATLATLLPACDDSSKLNKGNILQTAVDYVRDLQDANRALAAENQRLGGSGSVSMPARGQLPRTALLSAPTTAPQSDDDDDAAAPLSSTATSSPSAAPTRKRSSSRPSPALRARADKRHAASRASTSAASPVALPPTSTLMPPPLTLSTPHSPRNVPRPITAHAPLPPIGALAPAQSMPNSPSFRPHSSAARIADFALGNRHAPPAFAHPFFNSDVSSIRHHMQHPPGVLSPQNMSPGVLSLQNTPMMRPMSGLAPSARSSHPSPDFAHQ
ncbi:hypothetical protein H4R24_000301 [Coemansia sp. RSA 988]|nr:hypothetical protein H4R24_000301 [Coemansia sp. RSA 988]